MEAERTNGETLIWVQSLKGYGQATLKSAKSFMHFDGDCRQLKSWKERFLMEHKKIKQDIQTRLMRECGGTGNHFLNPPRDYVPGNMKFGNHIYEIQLNYYALSFLAIDVSCKRESS